MRIEKIYRGKRLNLIPNEIEITGKGVSNLIYVDIYDHEENFVDSSYLTVNDLEHHLKDFYGQNTKVWWTE